MTSALARRLEAFGALPEADLAVLNELSTHRRRKFEAGEDVVKEGDNPGEVQLVIEGFACRYKMLKDGRQQIVAYLLPGEFCDLHVFILEAMDHSISAISDCSIVNIPRETVLEMLERPALARALLMTTLVDEATLREWITNLGQRPARNRLAHFFCEMYLRMKVIGRVVDGTFDFPVNQAQVAASVGLSLVHTNKSLRVLKDKGAVRFRNGRITISDIALLEKIAGFKSNYLHLQNTAGKSLSSALEKAPTLVEG